MPKSIGPFLSGLVWAVPVVCAGSLTVKAAMGFEAQNGKSRIRVEAVADGILKVVAVPDGRPLIEPSSWAVLPQNRKATPGMACDPKRGRVVTRGLRASLDSAQGVLTFSDGRGQLLFEETARGFEASHLEATFHLRDGEPLFGLGQQEDGVLNRRGQKVRLIQSNRRMAIPFLASPGSGNGAWGLLWDNASHTEFEDGAAGMKLWSDVGEALIYYVIAAPDLDGVLAGLRKLTGEVPLLPKWAFGFWQSKERYESQAELVAIAEEYRRRKLPLDGVIQDWRYWGKYGWNAMRFDEATFPDPKGMVDKLHRLNAKVLISVWPNMELTTAVAKELVANQALATPASKTEEGGDLGVYDAFSAKGRQIYWEYLRKGIFSTGVDGLWMDATEPEFNAWTDDSLRQKTYVEKLPPNAAGPWLSNLNAYPLVDVEGVTKHWNASFSEQRPMILTRSAFLGQGRTGSVIWSGDIASSFQCLRRQIANGLNVSLSGLPYWNTDIGGFFPAWFGGEYPKGVKDPAYRELFVRWFQVGAFHPMFRAHGTSTPREIWRFGEPGQPEYDALARMLKLRYRLLPYLYSTAAELRYGAGSFLRPVAMDFPKDADVQDQFLCGRALMVSPVLEHQRVLEARQGSILDGSTITAPDGQPGLRMSVFASDESTATPAKVSLEPRAEFNWNLALPVGGDDAPFSLRLEGRLKPQAAPQILTVGCMGGMRAWVNGRQVVEAWQRGSFHLRHVPVDLASGADLRIEFHGANSSHLIAGLEPAATAAAPRAGRAVHLPEGGWVDFWNGAALCGGDDIWSETGLEAIPLHVKAGSILPLGPDKTYALEKPEDPLEVRVYPGADGHFELYEDDGTTRAYLKGQCSFIPFTWNDQTQTLRVGARRGRFQGMLNTRTLRIVLVRQGHGTGELEEAQADAVLTYTGKPLSFSFKATKSNPSNLFHAEKKP